MRNSKVKADKLPVKGVLKYQHDDVKPNVIERKLIVDMGTETSPTKEEIETKIEKFESYIFEEFNVIAEISIADVVDKHIREIKSKLDNNFLTSQDGKSILRYLKSGLSNLESLLGGSWVTTNTRDAKKELAAIHNEAEVQLSL